MTTKTRTFHIDLNKDMIEGAEYAILPGDPGRVTFLAKLFDPDAKFLANKREFVSYLANFHGHKVLVCSTGIGGPSAAIVMEELATLGIQYFLRIGTTGAIQPHIKLGDMIISRAAVRLDGASTHYAPIEYPAAASFEFTCDAVDAAKEANIPYHLGITATSDTFYPGQERYDNHNHYVLKRFQGSIAEWQKLNVTNYEMEASTILTMANVFNLHAACICGVIVNRITSEYAQEDALDIARVNWAKVVTRTVYFSMKRRGMISE